MDGFYEVYSRRMNYYETDKMGIIHHSNYIRLFEEARLDFMDKAGLNYAKMEDMGIIVPVMSAECRYLMPLRYGDVASVCSKMSKFDGIKMDMSYEVYKEGDKKPCAVGTTRHCFLDSQMKPFRMKRMYPDLYDKLKELAGRQKPIEDSRQVERQQGKDV